MPYSPEGATGDFKKYLLINLQTAMILCAPKCKISEKI
jgi:hypothetical protein